MEVLCSVLVCVCTSEFVKHGLGWQSPLDIVLICKSKCNILLCILNDSTTTFIYTWVHK